MKTLLCSLLALAIAPSAHAWESLTLHAGVSVAFAKEHKPTFGVDAGGSYTWGWETVTPAASARFRVLFDRQGPVLPQLMLGGGATIGPLTPLVSAQAEAGLVWVQGRARPAYGANVWSAPVEIVSPRLAASWTRFHLPGQAQDVFHASAGVALVAPTYVEFLEVGEPGCMDECD